MKLNLVIEDEQGVKTSLSAYAWNLVKDLKDAIQAKLHVPATRQRLFFSNKELRNTRSLCDCHISNNARIFLALAQGNIENDQASSLRLIGNSCPERLKQLVAAARAGLLHGLAPRLAMDGTGGTYFLRSSGEPVVVFKPADEEPFAPHNPRNYVGKMGQSGFRKGILSGEGYLREVAAYMLDSTTGFSGVPMTTVAEMRNNALHYSGKGLGRIGNSAADRTKIGSIQEYVHFDDVAGDLASKFFPVHEVHKIAILDIRLGNTDRNEANILVQRNFGGGVSKNGERNMNLIPIDHAYSLPDTLEIAWTDWVWLEWPQAKVPFDEKTREFVRNIDISADIDKLRTNLGIREPCLRTMRITCTVLKKGVEAGLTLRQIAGIICRNDLDVPSELEVMCSQAFRMAREAREQDKIKSPSLFKPLFTSGPLSKLMGGRRRTNSLPLNAGISRSMSYNNFKPLQVRHEGFAISQLEDTTGTNCPKRLDKSTHTWHLDDGKKGKCGRNQVRKPVAKLFFNYLDKLIDQKVELVARQTPETIADDVTECSTDVESPAIFSRQPAEFSSPSWISLTESAAKNASESSGDGLSFKKTRVVINPRPRSSMMSTMFKNQRYETKEARSEKQAQPQKNSSPYSQGNETFVASEKSWENHIPCSSFGPTFSPVPEIPLGKSSDSDWSKSELETEDGFRSISEAIPTGRRQWNDSIFNPKSRINGFAPPLGNNSLAPAMMSIPGKPKGIHTGLGMNISKSAPRKVPAWKPSWKIRREKEKLMKIKKSINGPSETTESMSKLKTQTPSDPRPLQPRRVVGGFA
eukprot:CAMPEP_0114528178 /NCGR_PEP_ID=MMETSP0109-20121206/24054_1 /TAXON_ID=29199 /ORGANISM="Chlorarachnion reptans, Strain CCCM449" /LENGTH=806 /DNA_ID=CAMNT_0001710279 /DNA_START=325 /DNA_END=2744 /DNA_ORIENTATION=+